MLYKKKTIEEVRPQRIAAAPVVETPTVHHDTVIERDDSSGTAIALAILAGVVILGLILYFAWWQPTYAAAPNPSTTVIEHHDVQSPAPSPSINVTTPPTVVNPPASNPVIVNPPANNSGSNNPPVHIDNNITTPPATTGGGSSDTSTGTDTSGSGG